MSRTEHHREQAMSAAHYYRTERIPERVEEALNTGYRLQPPDLPGYLSNYFAELSKPPVISDVRGRRVLGGAGNAALEVDVFCTVRNNEQKVCSVVISADAPPPLTCEAAEAEAKEAAMAVETAIEWIRESIGPMLRGRAPHGQSDIDHLLSEFFQPRMEEERRRRRENERMEAPSPARSARGSPSPVASPASRKKRGSTGKGKKLAVAEKPIPPAEPFEPVVRGSLALSAVSLAVAASSAILNNVPLYSYISALKHEETNVSREPNGDSSDVPVVPAQPAGKMAMPTPLITLLSCGKSSPGKLNLMKEVLMIPQPGLPAQQAVARALSLQAQIAKLMEGGVKSTHSGAKSVCALGCLELGGDRIDQPLDVMREACERLGLQLGTNVYLAINCAAHELMDYNKGKYEILSGTWKSPDEMVDLYVEVISRHPAIIALVDPLRKEDFAQWESLRKAVGSRCHLIADVASKASSSLPQGDLVQTSNLPQGDLVQTSSLPRGDLVQTSSLPRGDLVQTSSLPRGDLVQSSSLPQGDLVQTSNLPQGDLVQTSSLPQGDLVQTSNLPQGDLVQTSNLPQGDLVQTSSLPRGDLVQSSGAVLKYTNQMTISDLLKTVRRMEEEKRVTVLGCPHEDCSGSSVADLAVALCVPFIHLGGLLRGERTIKYNRLLAIEEELEQHGMLGSRSTFDFLEIWNETQSSEESRPPP